AKEWNNLIDPFRVITKDATRAISPKIGVGGYYLGKGGLPLLTTAVTLGAINFAPLEDDTKQFLSNTAIIAGSFLMFRRMRGVEEGGGIKEALVKTAKEGDQAVKWYSQKGTHVLAALTPFAASTYFDDTTLAKVGLSKDALFKIGVVGMIGALAGKEMWKNKSDTIFGSLKELRQAKIKSLGIDFAKNNLAYKTAAVVTNKWLYWGTTLGTTFLPQIYNSFAGDNAFENSALKEYHDKFIDYNIPLIMIGFGIVGPGMKEGVKEIREKVGLLREGRFKELGVEFGKTALPMIPTLAVGMAGYYPMQKWAFETQGGFANVLKDLLGFDDFAVNLKQFGVVDKSMSNQDIMKVVNERGYDWANYQMQRKGILNSDARYEDKLKLLERLDKHFISDGNGGGKFDKFYHFLQASEYGIQGIQAALFFGPTMSLVRPFLTKGLMNIPVLGELQVVLGEGGFKDRLIPFKQFSTKGIANPLARRGVQFANSAIKLIDSAQTLAGEEQIREVITGKLFKGMVEAGGYRFASDPNSSKSGLEKSGSEWVEESAESGSGRRVASLAFVNSRVLKSLTSGRTQQSSVNDPSISEHGRGVQPHRTFVNPSIENKFNQGKIEMVDPGILQHNGISNIVIPSVSSEASIGETDQAKVYFVPGLKEETGQDLHIGIREGGIYLDASLKSDSDVFSQRVQYGVEQLGKHRANAKSQNMPIGDYATNYLSTEQGKAFIDNSHENSQYKVDDSTFNSLFTAQVTGVEGIEGVQVDEFNNFVTLGSQRQSEILNTISGVISDPDQSIKINLANNKRVIINQEATHFIDSTKNKIEMR
ncbi:MAG: hypothetical protein KKE64_04115, partial [Candidatus Omnitrophica bacterium]|nr:hypothetical protein [Candidatus Omnitrophota bacterium]